MELDKNELGRLSEDLDAYMDWAQVWHRQAGGYAASDTVQVMMRMERWARFLKDMTGRPEKPLRKTDPQDVIVKPPLTTDPPDEYGHKYPDGFGR